MVFDIKKFLGQYFGFTAEIDSLSQRLAAQDLSIKEYIRQLADAKILLDSTTIQDKKTIAELQAKLAPDPNEVFWNNRYPKVTMNYSRFETDGQYSMDVRNYFQEYDTNTPTVAGATNDEKALNALKFVMGNITYTPDKSNYGWDEYWAYSYQTLTRRKGDCEDGAILMANIMLKSGIPFWRIRLNAGNVNGGGHCYVTYCRETDNQFVVLDWCYWSNNLPVAQRKLHSAEQNYDDVAKNFYVWFSWNSKYIFGKMQTMSTMPGEFVV